MQTLRELVTRVRDNLVSTADTVCLERARLVTEAWSVHADEPVCLRRAHAFAHVLQHMTLDLTSNPVLAGNTSSRPRAWMLVPEHGFAEPAQIVHENAGLKGILDQAVPQDLRNFWADRQMGGGSDPGHLAVDLDLVVHTGLEALLDRIHALKGQGTRAQQDYRRAMAICLRAVIDWAGSYAQDAEDAAAAETDPLIRQAHLRVAAACRHVPARPARTLFEGLQAVTLVHLALTVEGQGMSVSLGLLDRVFAPFADEGLDREQTSVLLAAFMLKIAANSIFGRGSKTQAITVGGADHRGRDQSNALTRCFLDAADIARVGDPHVFLRWHHSTRPELKERAAELLASGLSMPLLIHDEPTARGFIDLGVKPEHAWHYCVIGCNELGIPGLCCETAMSRAGNVQYLELINHVLEALPEPDSIANMEDLCAVLKDRMAERTRDQRRRFVDHIAGLPERAPVPLTSALMVGCPEAGEDLVHAMAYRIPGTYERGLTNGANALVAIQRLVFDERSLKLGDLVAAMKDNFSSGALREQLHAAPKWGNDDDDVDQWALKLLEMRERVLTQIDGEFGHTGHAVCHVVRSLHHLDGLRIGASPDGRLAREPVADSVGPSASTARKGPTATLNSVAKIDATRFYKGGYNLNITLTKAQTRPETVLPLIESFFAKGGQELQVNCLDPSVLRDAQIRPERHGDLVVRFAGLSSRFVDLSRVEQDELVARADVASHQAGVSAPPQ